MQLTGAAGRWSNVGVSLGVDQQGAQELTVAIDSMEELRKGSRRNVGAAGRKEINQGFTLPCARSSGPIHA